MYTYTYVHIRTYTHREIHPYVCDMLGIRVIRDLVDDYIISSLNDSATGLSEGTSRVGRLNAISTARYKCVARNRASFALSPPGPKTFPYSRSVKDSARRRKHGEDRSRDIAGHSDTPIRTHPHTRTHIHTPTSTHTHDTYTKCTRTRQLNNYVFAN